MRLLAIGAACAVALGIEPSAQAQEGHLGHGHAEWHSGFYNSLQRPDGKGSCCNMLDCRPTSIRTHGGRYEVKKDGRWIPVPMDKVIHRTAPDWGAHICAPATSSEAQAHGNFNEEVYCVIMPPDI